MRCVKLGDVTQYTVMLCVVSNWVTCGYVRNPQLQCLKITKAAAVPPLPAAAAAMRRPLPARPAVVFGVIYLWLAL